MTEPIPYSDLSALITVAQAKAENRLPMLKLEELRGWLESPRARQLAEFVYEQRSPEQKELHDDYRTVLALSGVPPSSSAAVP